MVMTDKEYTEALGIQCPFCNSTDIEGQEWEGDISSQKVACNDCDKVWWDRYKLTGFEEIK